MKKKKLLKNYFDGKISHGFVSLYTGKTIVMISSGLLGLFLPIFIYNTLGQSFRGMALFFGVGYLAYVLFLFFGVRFLNKFGFRRALRISVFLGALYYALFYFVDGGNFIKLAPFIIIVLSLYRVLYWMPYHVDFAKFIAKRNRGRQISALRATKEIIGVCIPLIAGFMINKFGFDVLFVTAVILYLISGIPYITIPRTREKFRWGYKTTLKNLFSPKIRKQMIAFMSDGAENVIAVIVWPIFIFQILDGDYFKIGALSTLVIAFTVTIQLMLGKYLDKSLQKEKILKFGSMLSSVGWLIKIFIATGFQIFIVGVFHNLSRIFTRIPFDVITYESAANQNHYVDEFTVLHELAINIGKVLAVIFAITVSFFLPMQYVFVLAATASVFLSLLRPETDEIIKLN